MPGWNGTQRSSTKYFKTCSVGEFSSWAVGTMKGENGSCGKLKHPSCRLSKVRCLPVANGSLKKVKGPSVESPLTSSNALIVCLAKQCDRSEDWKRAKY